MNSLKYRPMAVIGITALILNFVAILTGLVFSCGLIFIAVGAVMTVILLISKEFGKSAVITYICAAMIFSGILMLTSSLFGIDAAEKYDGQQCDVVATVTDDMAEHNNSNAYVLKTNSINGTKCDFKIILYSKSFFDFEPGDKIAFNSKLCDNTSSKLFTSRISNFSDERYLYTYFFDSADITLVKSGEKTIQHRLYLIRNEIRNRIYDFLPGEEGAVTIAMLIGDKTDVSNKTIDNFSTTGISHLFAVSGLHLSVWIASLYLILKKFIKRNRISEVLCIVFTLLFMALTGFSASVCRAGLMLIIVFLGKIFDEETDSLNSLGFALFIILSINPMSAVSFSLLLSFCATLGIITLYPFLERKTYEKLFSIKDKKMKKILRYILNLIEISVSATIFTLPVSAFFIGSVSLIAPITNLFVSFAATTQMIFGGLSTLLYRITFLSKPFALVCGLLAKYIIGFSSFLAEIHFCSVETESIYFRVSLLLIITFAICFCMLVSDIKKRLISFVAVLTSVSIIFTSLYFAFDYSKTFIDVFNAGAGLFVQINHRGRSVILGCGGSENYPDDNISSAIKSYPDLLIIPDRSTENSSMFLYYIESFKPKKIVCGENNQSVSMLRQDCIFAQDFSYKFSENSALKYIKNQEASFAYYNDSNSSVLVVFSCENSESIPKDYFKSEYIVMCNGIIDDFDLTDRENIIVPSDVNESDFIEIET